jgi:hypothetical protein
MQPPDVESARRCGFGRSFGRFSPVIMKLMSTSSRSAASPNGLKEIVGEPVIELHDVNLLEGDDRSSLMRERRKSLKNQTISLVIDY